MQIGITVHIVHIRIKYKKQLSKQFVKLGCRDVFSIDYPHQDI